MELGGRQTAMTDWLFNRNMATNRRVVNNSSGGHPVDQGYMRGRTQTMAYQGGAMTASIS